MDHIASVYGGICHFDFKNIDNPIIKKISDMPNGDYILIDSKQKKDTIKVLSNAKKPVLEALVDLPSIREMYSKRTYEKHLKSLPDNLFKPLYAAIDNYIILNEFIKKSDKHKLTDSFFYCI